MLAKYQIVIHLDILPFRFILAKCTSCDAPWYDAVVFCYLAGCFWPRDPWHIYEEIVATFWLYRRELRPSSLRHVPITVTGIYWKRFAQSAGPGHWTSNPKATISIIQNAATTFFVKKSDADTYVVVVALFHFLLQVLPGHFCQISGFFQYIWAHFLNQNQSYSGKGATKGAKGALPQNTVTLFDLFWEYSLGCVAFLIERWCICRYICQSYLFGGTQHFWENTPFPCEINTFGNPPTSDFEWLWIYVGVIWEHCFEKNAVLIEQKGFRLTSSEKVTPEMKTTNNGRAPRIPEGHPLVKNL